MDSAHIWRPQGHIRLPGSGIGFVCHPRNFKKPLNEAFQWANELKVIVYNNNDFQWAESMADKVEHGCKLFLQPEWSKSKQMLPQIINYVKNNPHLGNFVAAS